MRGISGGKIDRDLPGVKEQVGVYMDESVISLSLFTPDLDLYDLNRVEVLRGPQGTLFGSGSIGGHGALHQQPAGPFGRLRQRRGRHQQIVGRRPRRLDARAMMNMPLGDRAALRVVGYFNELPGFIDAHRPGGTVDEDVNGGERAGRTRWRCAGS